MGWPEPGCGTWGQLLVQLQVRCQDVPLEDQHHSDERNGGAGIVPLCTLGLHLAALRESSVACLLVCRCVCFSAPLSRSSVHSLLALILLHVLIWSCLLAEGGVTGNVRTHLPGTAVSGLWLGARFLPPVHSSPPFRYSLALGLVSLALPPVSLCHFPSVSFPSLPFPLLPVPFPAFRF